MAAIVWINIFTGNCFTDINFTKCVIKFLGKLTKTL